MFPEVEVIWKRRYVPSESHAILFYCMCTYIGEGKNPTVHE